MTAITVHHVWLRYDCILNMLRPSPDALTVNMTRAPSHHSRLAPGGGGAPASPPFPWDVPRVVFSSCKGMNIPVFFCSGPLWVLAHHCRCPTFHSSADPSSQGARAVQDAVLPWLGYTSWPGLCNSTACARKLTKVPPGNRLLPFVSGFPPADSAQSQRPGGDQLPATASPRLSFSPPAKHPPLLSTTTPHRVRRDSCKHLGWDVPQPPWWKGVLASSAPARAPITPSLAIGYLHRRLEAWGHEEHHTTDLKAKTCVAKTAKWRWTVMTPSNRTGQKGHCVMS